MRQASRERAGTAALAGRLRERRPEIEQATLTRVHAVSGLPANGGPEYAQGLRLAVAAGVEYGLEGIERGEQGAPPVPDALLSQARLAARLGVSLDTVLRRYFAGHTLLEDFMVEEAEGEGFAPAELKRLLRSQAAIVDRLLAAVSKTYAEEAKAKPQTSQRRRAQLIERLLGGEPLDASELGYELNGWHLGLLASGAGAPKALSSLARELDCNLLALRRDEGVAWGWLGSRRRLDPREAQKAAKAIEPGPSLAIGEPGEGIPGWRLTHCQARAALSIALSGEERVVRYAAVALLASILGDDLLAASLRQLYLEPLAEDAEERAALQEVLRAYLAKECNVSGAALSLGVSRQTVGRRLSMIETRIGRRINDCAVELEVALRLGAHDSQVKARPG